jgi:hypothetical protein
MVLHLVGRDFNSTELTTSHHKNECMNWTYIVFHTILSPSWSPEAFLRLSHQNHIYYSFMYASCHNYLNETFDSRKLSWIIHPNFSAELIHIIKTVGNIWTSRALCCALHTHTVVYEYRSHQNAINMLQTVLKYRRHNLPPSSSESDMKVSCIVSGATTRYFSSAPDVTLVGMEGSVTTLSVSTTLMYPSFWAMDSAVCPCCLCKIMPQHEGTQRQ